MLRKLFFFFVFVSAISAHGMNNERDSLLRVLDHEVSGAAQYLSLHEIKIANARKELQRSAGNEEYVRRLRLLANLFGMYQSDSAFAYNQIAIRHALSLNDDELYVNLMTERAQFLSLAGLPTHAFQLLDTLINSRQAASPELKKIIYEAYFDINDFIYHYNLPGFLMTENARFIAAIRDSFYHYCPEEMEQALHTNAAITSTKEIIEKLKDRMDHSESDMERGLLAMIISNRYRAEAMPEQRDIFLILSAIYNIRAARMDNEALIILGKDMITAGDWDRAVAYLCLAHKQALFYGSRSRELQLSPLLQQIGEHLSARARSWKSMTVMVGLVLLVLLAVSVMSGVGLRKRNRSLLQLVNTLKSTSAHVNARESSTQAQIEAQADAMTQFMGIATDATFEFVHLRQLVVRKLKNNDAQALLKQLTAENSTGKIQTELLRKFDIAFMRLYPDFIAKVNALMLPEAQISKPEDELMSTELRLLALWRLGLTEAGRVATILNLSVNTIYFYRNKLRNGAKDREHFNDGIMAIQGV